MTELYRGAQDAATGRRDGKGTYSYPNGCSYTGNWQQGVKHGQGRFYVGDTEDEYYEGEFLHGAITGRGRRVYRGGATYEGDFVEGERHGYGTFTGVASKSASVGGGKQITYVGEWRDNKFHGRGRLEFAGGVYEGGFENHLFHGQGRLDDTATQSVYTGEFHSGQRQGYADVKWANGDTYQGHFRAGKRHGDGRFFDCATGMVLDVRWKEGRPAENPTSLVVASPVQDEVPAEQLAEPTKGGKKDKDSKKDSKKSKKDKDSAAAAAEEEAEVEPEMVKVPLDVVIGGPVPDVIVHIADANGFVVEGEAGRVLGLRLLGVPVPVDEGDAGKKGKGKDKDKGGRKSPRGGKDKDKDKDGKEDAAGTEDEHPAPADADMQLVQSMLAVPLPGAPDTPAEDATAVRVKGWAKVPWGTASGAEPFPPMYRHTAHDADGIADFTGLYLPAEIAPGRYVLHVTDETPGGSALCVRLPSVVVEMECRLSEEAEAEAREREKEAKKGGKKK